MKTLNALYKRFTLFYARLTTCTLPILFLSVVIMFYIFASFKQIWTAEYTGLVEVMLEGDQGSKKSTGYKQTILWVSGRQNYHLVDWIKPPLGRVSVCLLQRGVKFVRFLSAPWKVGLKLKIRGTQLLFSVKYLIEEANIALKALGRV